MTEDFEKYLSRNPKGFGFGKKTIKQKKEVLRWKYKTALQLKQYDKAKEYLRQLKELGEEK